jgi:hypothetical protein
MNRSSWLLAMVGFLALAVGCAMQVPSPDMKYQAQQKVVMTFRGGEQVRGRIDTGNRVELREPGIVWNARVGDITDKTIVLKDLVRIRDDRGVVMQVARAEDARLGIAPPVPDKTLLVSDITKVELLKLDPGRTARNASFWTYGAVVLALLLGERS